MLENERIIVQVALAGSFLYYSLFREMFQSRIGKWQISLHVRPFWCKVMKATDLSLEVLSFLQIF